MIEAAAPTFNRAAFYAWLDDHGVPFRDTIEVLKTTNQIHASVWPDGAHHIWLPMSKPLLPDLAHAPEVRLGRGVVDEHAPDDITLAIRKTTDAARNVAIARTALEAAFGPATTSQINATIRHEWLDPVDPNCSIKLTGFPDTPKGGHRGNARHAAIDGSATEASIVLRPDYSPAYTQGELETLANARPILEDGDAKRISVHLGWPNAGFARPCPDGMALSHGLWWVGQRGDLAVVDHGGRNMVLARDAVDCVVCTTITPARGRGGYYIALRATVQGHSRDVPLYGAAYNDTTGPRLAARIAQALDIPLTPRTWEDD